MPSGHLASGLDYSPYKEKAECNSIRDPLIGALLPIFRAYVELDFIVMFLGLSSSDFSFNLVTRR